MNYRDNVQAMRDEMGVPNPIPEEFLVVDSLSFRIGHNWQDIDGTSMNRAARLYIQYHVPWDGYINATSFTWAEDPMSVYADKIIPPIFIELAPAHFVELWEDAEAKGRTLLVAMKQADAIIVRWKVPW